MTSDNPATIQEKDSAFPVGGGELGALIRRFDWSRTALGPIETWPHSLRTATNIVLQSPLPLVMLWGPDGVMIYNDAYSIFAGQRHPRLLGSKVLEGWAEVASFNAHVLEVGLAGGTLSFKDQELTLYRNTVPEQVWMDLSYGPVLGDDNTPAGVLAIVVETTEHVRSERRQAFRLALGDRLRNLLDAGDITIATAEMLGRHLLVDRVGWAEMDETNQRFTVERDWTNGTMPTLAGAHRLGSFGAAVEAEFQAGRVVVMTDTQDHPLTASPEVAAAFAAGGIRSVIALPLIRTGRVVAVLYVNAREPRAWRDDEVALIREVADRTWAAVQRALAEKLVRESEARFRALVNATSDVVYRMSPNWTEMRRLDGRGFLPDTESPSVAWQDEYLFAEDRPQIHAAIEQAIRTKSVFQLEHRVRRVDRTAGWTLSRAIPLLDSNGEIIEWFGTASDVTPRREAEEHLRLIVNELNHRVKNNLAMIQGIAAQTFRDAEDLTEARASFSARIIALAQANDLLTGERWIGVSLRDILNQALRPYCGEGEGRCLIDGPDIQLSPKTALSLSMAMHELATNAIKYGAWSAPCGRVAVSWATRTAGDGDCHLRLEWREAGGPRVSVPTRRGFGSRLIERGLAAELGGAVRMLFEPDGLVCVVEAPLAIQGEA